MNRHEELQRIVRHYKQVMDKSDVTMPEVVEWAVKNLGLPIPEPIDPLKRLAREFSQAMRVEETMDDVTGLPYRVNHAYMVTDGDQQLAFWVNIDDPATTRPKMLKCLNRRRESMVGDAWHLFLDQEHWNRIHPDVAPIQIELDFGPDIVWKKNARTPEGSVA